MGSKQEEESSMEASEFPADPPNSASCLPPRKRLLAGLRMQNGFLPPSSSSPSSSLSSSSSSSPSSSTSSSLSPLLSSLSLSTPFISSASSEFGVHICDFLNGNRRIFLSPEEVIEASRSAAVAAAGIAAAAKATALEKAEIAAKAAAAAKNALELVASSTDETFSRVYRKGKPKKHVPVKLLYKNKSVKENCEPGRTKGNSNSCGRITKRKSDSQDIGDGENRFKVLRQGKTIASQEHVDDEEFAFQLHRAMNSSPRILKKTMSAVLKTEDKPNDSDISSKTISHKKHRESKYALLEKVPVSEESQICKGNATSLSDGHGNNHVESQQSTCNIVDSLATKVKSSIRYSTEDCSQQCEDRSTIPHEEGKADHSMVDGKQQVGASESETGSHGKLMFKHKKLLLNLSTVRNSKNQPLDLKSAQGKKSEVLQHQEESEPKGFSSVELSAPRSFVERLTSEHDVRNKPLFMLTSSEQHEASNEASGIWNFRKLMFPQSQCVAESKSLCSLHTNPTVTTVCSSIKVDE